MKLYQRLAQLVGAYKRCKNTNTLVWMVAHSERIDALCRRHMPHGSGLDSGMYTKLDLDASSEEKLVFPADFHHMNENGFYDGWTSHSVIVRPSLAFNFFVKVTGRDRNEIKAHILDLFRDALSTDVEG